MEREPEPGRARMTGCQGLAGAQRRKGLQEKNSHLDSLTWRYVASIDGP